MQPCCAFNHDRPVNGVSSMARYSDAGTISVQGSVSEDPDVRGRSTFLRLSVEKVEEKGTSSEVSGKVLLKLGVYPEYRKGDVLVATGRIKAPQSDSFADAAGPVKKRATYGVDARMDYPKVEVLKAASVGPASWVRSVRQRLSTAIASALPEPQAALGQAILLGERTSIPSDLNKAFARTGTMHMLAISGWNITIVAGMMLALAVRVLGKRRFLYVWVAIAALWLYAVLTGLLPPVLRAAAMATIFFLAVYFGRQGSALVAITFAAAIMLAFEPHLIWNVSFQLSFVSMAGLIVLTPPITDLARSLIAPATQERRFFRETLDFFVDATAVTLGAIIATLPLLAYYFGTVSLVSPAANLAIFPVLPLIMATTAATAAVGFLVPAAGLVVGWTAMPFLAYMAWAVHLFDRLPFAAWKTGTFPAWAVLAYYLILAVLLLLPRIPRMRTRFLDLHFRAPPRASSAGGDRLLSLAKWSAMVLVPTALLLWSAVLWSHEDRLRVSFLDVGDGDAILVSTPQGRHVLIDGGPDPEILLQQLGAQIPFWDRKIDLVVLTHPHADHLTGLVPVLQRYGVRQILERPEPYTSLTYAEWHRAIEQQRIPIANAAEGQIIDLGGGAAIRILHSGTDPRTGGDPDQAGIVIRLDYGKVSFLLTGDAVEEVEQHLIEERFNTHTTVLKVAHHGSMTSTSAAFLSVAHPGIAVVSVGASNNLGLPAPAVMKRIEAQSGPDKVFSTAVNGTVEVATDGTRVWVRTAQ